MFVLHQKALFFSASHRGGNNTSKAKYSISTLWTIKKIQQGLQFVSQWKWAEDLVPVGVESFEGI